MKNILLISKLIKGSGNLHTIERIRTYLSDAGYHCTLVCPEDFGEDDDFKHYVKKNQIDIIIGLHAFKAGKFLQDIDVPFIIIIGGTDVNETYQEENKFLVMSKAVRSARKIIIFGSSLLQRTKELWPELDMDKLVTIKQAVQTSPSKFSLSRYIQEHHSELYREDMVVCICMGSIRPVKNPLYLVNAFSDFHRKQSNVIYVLCGSTTDEEYGRIFKETISKLPGIIYIPGLPLPDAHAAIQQSYAFINSSDSEGMALAVLEAMQLKTLVIVRNIPANLELVKNDDNGLVFSSPKECISCLNMLMNDNGIRHRLVTSAYQYVRDNHSVKIEQKCYTEVLSCIV